MIKSAVPAKLIMLFLAAVLSTACFAKPAASPFWMNFPQGAGPYWFIVLPVSGEQKVFRDAMTAIDLLDVRVDGILLTPKIVELPDHIDTMVIPVPSGTIFYQFTQEKFGSWIEIDKSHRQSRSAKMFEISQSAKKVEINYRLRRADGSMSENSQITFLASQSPTQQIDLPQR